MRRPRIDSDNIKTCIKPFYEIDGKLLKSMDLLCETLLKALNDDYGKSGGDRRTAEKFRNALFEIRLGLPEVYSKTEGRVVYEQ